MEKESIKKARAPKGERSQRLFTFRLDNENAEWVQQQPNKGRYINRLIEADRTK